ncbi:MAG: hypothetical protein FWE42_08230 [Defluviitaleaceae bacterium]|nr:hypothetical protein [Defluviitaleaceae bacterium]
MNQARKEAIKKTQDFYAMKKGAKILQHDFGYYSLDRWIAEGHVKDRADIEKLWGADEKGVAQFGGLGWCEVEFYPEFEVKVIEDRGEYELVHDHAGRHVLYFKGRRNGFMPEYVTHPVTDRESWERDIKWRMDPSHPSREPDPKGMAHAQEMAANGAIICQGLIGGYMYLRSLVGPEGALYMFYDDPDLIHDMMEAWFNLADPIIARHQTYAQIDELFLAEDICYNGGPLISPDMMREFLFPYYQQLITNIKARQPKKGLPFIQIDTDGDCRPVIPVYKELGANYFSPYEVASGCDVVELRKQYPELLMRGGIDKRELAKGKDAIDRMVDRIMPFMSQQGGYIPTCDHGVPEEVAFEDYMHFRQRLKEF